MDEPVVVFRYRYEGAPGLLHHADFPSLDTYQSAVLQPPGDFVVYQGKGRPGEDGIYPRLELVERVSVAPIEPAEPKVTKPEKF